MKMTNFEEIGKIINAYNRLLEQEVEGVNFGDDYKGTLAERITELEKRGIKGPIGKVVKAYVNLSVKSQEFNIEVYNALATKLRIVRKPEPTFDEDYDGRY